MEHEHIHGTYDSLLVIFSYVVAIVASYNVLDLAGRISETSGRSRLLWLLFGAVTMGMGIWSMHFVGMLAFSLPFPVAYDLTYILLSVLAAIVASYFALYVAARDNVTVRQLLGSGLLLAIGISTMHYTGMAAMQIGIRYDPPLFALSILIAFAASVAALWLAIYFRGDKGISGVWKKLGSGLIMGAAIAGMHYIGMAAAHFHSHPGAGSSGLMLDSKWLAIFIAIGTLLTLGLSLLGIFISKRLSHKDSEIQEKAAEIYFINQELRKLNEHLEESVRERTAELEKARDEAVKANRIKSQFLANMSHELRTPLNAIIGYSEMLLEEAEESGEDVLAEDLSKIRNSGKHLLTLINDILDISKIEAGKMEVYYELCDLQSLVQDVVTTVKPQVEANGNRLDVRSMDGLITTDVTKLRQILLNLLSNAGKFTNDGTIQFDIYRDARNHQEGYAFKIQDTGIGMAPEQIDKIFQPFTQADSSTTRKYGGTGLGLAISQHFINLMGGDSSVTSELGAGSTFTCWFPADPSNTTVTAKEEAAPKPDDEGAGQADILLIDDERSSRELLQQLLAKEGWTIAVAEDGKKGLQLAKTLRPKVICLDIFMPAMDGWSVLSALKADPGLKGIPVVILTMSDDRNLGFALGASEYIMKPVSRDRLIEVMDKYIAIRNNHSVLVIEDDETTSDMMAKLLHRDNYKVVKAQNGKVALEYLKVHIPGLIILDLMMPVMDGFQFVQEIRKHDSWSSIPIVVLSAKSISMEERMKLDGYVKRILQKGSTDHKWLLTEIRRVIEGEAS